MVPICKTAASASTIDKEAEQRLVSPGVEYHLTNYLMYVSHPGSDLAPFLGSSSCTGQRASIPKLNEDHLWTKLSARIKGGFSFVSFSPCLYLGPCEERLDIRLNLLYVLLLHFESPV